MVCKCTSTPALPDGDLCEYQTINTFADFGHRSSTTEGISGARPSLDTSLSLCHCKRSGLRTKQNEANGNGENNKHPKKPTRLKTQH